MKAKLFLIHVFTIFVIWMAAQFVIQIFGYAAGFAEYLLIAIAAAWLGTRARNYFARRMSAD